MLDVDPMAQKSKCLKPKKSFESHIDSPNSSIVWGSLF